jgi:hypothetical protein
MKNGDLVGSDVIQWSDVGPIICFDNRQDSHHETSTIGICANVDLIAFIVRSFAIFSSFLLCRKVDVTRMEVL